MKSHRARVAETLLVLVSICCGVYGFETALLLHQVGRAKLERRLPLDLMRAARAAGRPFDARTRLDVVTALRRESPGTVPVMPPSYYTLFGEKLSLNGTAVVPIGGVSREKTVYCNETGEFLVYESDEHGFHNPRGLYQAPLDVLVLGDSFAHGACVRADENVAAGLRRALPRTVSAGYADNGPLGGYAALAELGPRLQPSHVVWLYYEGNDMDGLTTERRHPVLASYLAGRTYGLLEHQDEIDAALRALADQRLVMAGESAKRWIEEEDWKALGRGAGDIPLARHTRRLLSLLPVFATGNVEPQGPHPDLPLFREIVLGARDRAAAWGGKLTFVYLPEWQSFAVAGFKRRERSDVLRTVRELDVPLVDMLPVIAKQSDPLSVFPFRSNGHYTAAGYALVAREILAALPARSMSGR